MGLGMPEVVLILVIALIVFGPRKLPELGKSLGQAMGQFRKASDEFKRTWEQEVELDKLRIDSSSTTSTASNSSNYSSNYDNGYESGYHTDSDYQYGYDATAGAAGAESNVAATQPTASNAVEGASEVASTSGAAATVNEKKPEPHWI